MSPIKTVDIFKFVASLLVVCLHTQVFYDNEDLCYYVKAFCRIAVPFFFTVSSFFFWKKENRSIKKYTIRILQIYFIWFLIELPFVYERFFLNEDSYENNLIIFTHHLVFSNTFFASWYLMASVISMNIVFILSKHFSNKLLLFISLLFYTTSCLSSTYFGLVNYNKLYLLYDSIFIPSNSFIVAFIYIVIGKIIAESVIDKSRKDGIITIIACMLGGVEIYFTKELSRYTDAYVSLPIFLYFFFCFILKKELSISSNICKFLRDSSILIYLLHGVLIKLNTDILKLTLGTELTFIVIIESIALGSIIILLSKKVHVIKKLY